MIHYVSHIPHFTEEQMLVTVEYLVKKMMRMYGFSQILADHDLTKEEVIQVLHDHGYINLERYEEEE